MSRRQAEHQRIRQSAEWKSFRNAMGDTDKVDALTGKPLHRGWNLHHLCLLDSEYGNFESDRFVCLNRKSHDCVHFLWGKDGRDWRRKLDNLAKILSRMEELNT